MSRPDYPRLKVTAALPDFLHGPGDADPVLQRLRGATVVAIGAPELPAGAVIEGGGLVIDYKIEGYLYRLVLGCTELGMWVEYDSFPVAEAA